MKYIRILILNIFITILFSSPAFSQQIQQERITKLESKVSTLEYDIKSASDTGLVLLLFGAFCALWAQNTNRNPWLWFFLGLFFSAFTIAALLFKNSADKLIKKIDEFKLP
jgi:hypothetical protein